MMVQPNMISLMDWAASLQIDFPNDDIPLLEREDAWFEWGDKLKMSDSFQNIPSTYGYNNYQDWMNEVYYIIEG